MNELIKQWLIDKRKNIIVEIIVKYKNKSKKKSFNLFEKIEFYKIMMRQLPASAFSTKT